MRVFSIGRRGIAGVAGVMLLAVTSARAMPLRLMSFNTWHAGSQVVDGTQKVIDAVVAAGADVVAFQETEGWLAAEVASALGGHALQGPGSVGIASRYPIAEVFGLARDEAGLGVRLRVADDPPRDVIVWSVHLGYTDYGPYAACGGASPGLLRRGESISGRVRQIRDVLRRMRREVTTAGAMPVFVLGDFNAPSHLDWLPATAPLHCGTAMRWPVSQRVERAGFIDLFRAVHPDPVAEPGTTWSTVYPAPSEPQDRIDLVYAAGAVIPLSAEIFVIGTPAPYPEHGDNAWPSDHAAAVATVEVTPTAAETDAAPQLVLDRSSFAVGESIVATVSHGPANGSDWVGLYGAGNDPLVDPVVAWRYLNGTQVVSRNGRAEATVVFPAGTLGPGNYVAHLLYAGGYGVLTEGATFAVTP